MPRPSSRGRLVVVLIASLSLGACGSTAAPSLVGNPAPSLALPSAPAASPAPSASAAATATPTQVPAATPTPAATPEPTDSPEPTNAPDPTPAPLPSPKMAASCPTGEDWLSASPDRVPKTLAFGHATIEYTSAGIGLLDGSQSVDDVIPGGVGLSPKEIAVVVAPGEHVILRASGLTLSHVAPGVGPWSEVSFQGGLASLPAGLAPLAWRYRSDGSISISAPLEPGDYAVDFNPSWFGSCLEGDGTAYGRLKVVAP